MYLIAATVLPDEIRLSGLERILPRGAVKLHWRDLGIRVQREMLRQIAKLETKNTIVVSAPINPRRQERARRKTLEVLLPILEKDGIEKFVMESRFPAADAKDISHFQSMKKKGLIESIGIEFADPAMEHRLWIPDQILGAYGETAVGSRGATAWANEWDALRGSITVIKDRL